MIRFDYNNFMSEAIGAEHGLAEADLASVEKKADAALERMAREKGAGRLGFLEVPYDETIVRDIRAYKKKLGGRFDTVALIGIGGSCLGPQALKNALSHLYLNELPGAARGDRCKIYYFDNIDPFEIEAARDVLDVTKTLFLVISKSGGTVETNANFAILLDMLKRAVGGNYAEHIVAITDPEKGTLRTLATAEGFQTFPVPDNVGGRFSVLSAVGLVMAEFTGIDAAGLLAGARNVVQRYYGTGLRQNAPLLNASFHYLFDTVKGKRINVLMPYTRKLFLFADWYRQLWAESLGKNTDANGAPTVAGLTPVSALGAIDQHSQLQLYLEGPNDKVITFMKLDDFGRDVTIPEFYPDQPEMGYLSNKSLRALNRFEESATELVLAKAARPNCSLVLPTLTAETVGEFIMFLEMQTAYAGYLYNINPYDQPAVEQGKKYAFGLLERSGYDEFRDRFAAGYVKKDAFIL
ncbi:MAG TPA: glucose-6-phosphate isomerase [Spirochaetota bacterium]|nr:glucose-6-phosphate isomerase [Spirochaetota bacterium]HNT10134.1 glucose-6-phosphate isomerase [Spirochaetota bacterium]